MAETVFVLCDNGSVIEHDLPLPSGIATRVESGQLRLVNADGSQIQPEVEPPASDEMPDNTSTIAVIVAWVGDDPERAMQALTAEEARDKPRATLVAALTALLEQSTE